MTIKQWSEIQNQLGYIEGLAASVDGHIGDYLGDAVCASKEMMEKAFSVDIKELT